MPNTFRFVGAIAVLLAVLSAAAVADGTTTVINKGSSGRNSRTALQMVEKDVLALKPQHVIVYFGMNDSMNSGNLCPLPEFEANIRGIVSMLSANGVETVALVTINPVIEEYVRARHPKHPQKEAMQAYLATYDQAVRKIAAELKLPLIDLRAIIEANGGATVSEKSLIRCDANGGGRDGVHLTAAGYSLLGEAAFAVLKDRVKPGDRIVCYGDSLTFGANMNGAGTTQGEPYPAVLQHCLDQQK